MRILLFSALLAACSVDEDDVALFDAAIDYRTIEEPPCFGQRICDPHCGYLYSDALSCEVQCPNTPPNEWCPVIGVHDSCCQCQFNAAAGWHWENLPLECGFGPDAGMDGG